MRGMRIDDDWRSIPDRKRSWEWGSSNAEPRRGISVCEDFDDLVAYFSYDMGMVGRTTGRVAPEDIADAELVTVEGRLSDDRDHDHDHPGHPYLLVDVEVVSHRPLTWREVYLLCWGDREAEGPRDLKQRLEEMNAIAPRYNAEDIVGVQRERDLPGLNRLLRDPVGSYALKSYRKGTVIWHDAAGEYQVAPTPEIRP